ncbi:MAG: type II toxin-antitoxin system RelE/ParE family toxin [Lewinellaceae bacterium]|nr:type II toxin-antitoxin system RelE/ParE family toxin [Lewinellaceae bacterium]
MSLPIIWAPSAKDEYAALLEYVEGNFGLDAALELLDTTEKLLEGIAAFPGMFPASEKRKDIRKAVVSRQTSLLYRIFQDQIQILHVWDNRQDPDKLEFLL